MSSTRMRLGALAVAGALTWTLSACADDDGGAAEDPTTPASTQDSGPATGAASTEDTAATGDTGATSDGATSDGGSADAAEGEEVAVADFMAMLREPGEETLSSYTLEMSMEVDGQSMDVEGAVDQSGDAPAMAITMSVPDLGEVELILVDGEVFMSLTGLMPPGTFIEAPPELTQDLEDLEDIDVSAVWDTWESSAEKVVYLGEDDVDGTQMRSYEITVDGEAVDQALETAGEQLGDDAAATSLAPEGPVVYRVWLDDDNLIRQLRADLDGDPVEMRLDNWGEVPDITAPDPEDILDPSELGGATG